MRVVIGFYKKINTYFETNKVLSALCGIILLILTIYLDYQVPPEISLSIVYLLPIALITWFIGRSAGFATCWLSAIAEFVSHPINRQTPNISLVSYWNATILLTFFLTISYLLAQLRRVLEQSQELARIDVVTGIGNKRLFCELANLELKKSQRYRHSFTIITIDIDDFKRFNEMLGYSCGNQLLQEMALTLKNTSRETDILARTEGDEFTLLLPGSGYDSAQIVVHRIHQRLMEVMQEHHWPVTFSIGAITFINPPNSVEAMLQHLDRLMYLIKRDGKNNLNHRISVETEL
ncbi:MAG TPA: diguanylate cyclase [Cyanophyceae cyanobacterium]